MIREHISDFDAVQAAIASETRTGAAFLASYDDKEIVVQHEGRRAFIYRAL